MARSTIQTPGAKPVLEICVDSVAGLLAAEAGGADRIELASALELSGLTPSAGLLARSALSPLPVYAMVRPRSGDFVYETDEVDQMRRDIDAVRHFGLAGVVLGASRPDGQLDEATLQTLSRHAEGLGRTLHRAFDLAPDLDAALETAIGLGFERVLTSGAAPSAPAALERLAALQAAAKGRIAILAGGGVTPAAVEPLVRRAGLCELHASASEPAAPAAWPARGEALFAAQSPPRRRTSARSVRALKDALAAAMSEVA